MNREEAVITALKIVNECKKHQNQCLQCPFNIKGCIVVSEDMPTEWTVNEIFNFYIRKLGN